MHTYFASVMIKSTGLISMHFFSKTARLSTNHLQNGYLQWTANHTKAPGLSEKCPQIPPPLWNALGSLPLTAGCPNHWLQLSALASSTRTLWLTETPWRGATVSGTTPTRADPEQAGEEPKLCWGAGCLLGALAANQPQQDFLSIYYGIWWVNRSGWDFHA